MTPRKLEDWEGRYESRGYRVLIFAYPGSKESRRRTRPIVIEDLTVPAVDDIGTVAEHRAGADPDGPSFYGKVCAA